MENNVMDHDLPREMGAPVEPWSGSAADGQPTLALPLAELAAMHDPHAKAPAVRHSPPPPLARGNRPGVRPPGEPLTGAGLAPASPVADAAAATVPAVAPTAPAVPLVPPVAPGR